MLVLTRKPGEKIQLICGDVLVGEVEVLDVDRNRVRIGVSAEKNVDIIRPDAKKKPKKEPVPA